jgi:hypothetical protein
MLAESLRYVITLVVVATTANFASAETPTTDGFLAGRAAVSAFFLWY